MSREGTKAVNHEGTQETLLRAFVASCLCVSALSTSLRAEQVVLAARPKGQVITSADARRWAYIDDRKDRFAVVVDGRPHSPYEWIINQKIAFTADSRQVVYAARSMQKQFMVIDGIEGPPLVEIRDWVVAGNRVISSEAVKAEWYMVREGDHSEILKRVRLVEGLAAPAFVGGTTGARVRERLFFAGKGQEAFDQIGTVVVSPDGKRVAYAARSGDRWSLVTDGRSEGRFDRVLDVRFSPDSKHAACVAQNGNDHVIVLDGAIAAKHESIRPEFDLSERGKLAWVIRSTTEDRPVIDGKEMPGHLAVEQISLSPDGEHWAAFVRNRTGAALVIDGREFGPFASLSRTSLNWSGRHLVVVAQRDGRSLMLIDGQERAAFAHIYVAGPAVVENNSVRFIADDGKNLLRVNLNLQ